MITGVLIGVYAVRQSAVVITSSLSEFTTKTLLIDFSFIGERGPTRVQRRFLAGGVSIRACPPSPSSDPPTHRSSRSHPYRPPSNDVAYLTKVQYERLPAVFSTPNIWQQLALSIILNWVIAPFIMLGLAWATLPEKKLASERQGVVLVGIARCIGEYMCVVECMRSMVLLFNLKLWSSFGADSQEGTRICAQSSFASTQFFRSVVVSSRSLCLD
jgi:hypothetical protein